MQLNTIVSITDIIQFVILCGTFLAIFYRKDSEFKSTQKDIAVMQNNMESFEKDCASCRRELRQEIANLDERTSTDYREMSVTLKEMEKGLRGDINSLRNEIIDILKKK